MSERSLVAAPPAVPTGAGSIGATAALLETRRAVHGLVAAGLERHLGLLAAARTGHAEHLARPTAATATVRRPIAAAAAVRRRPTVALRLAGGATIGTATRLAEAPAGVEVLFAAGKRKRLAAVAAGKSGISRHRRRLPSKSKQLGGWPKPSEEYRAPSNTSDADRQSCGTNQTSGTSMAYPLPRWKPYVKAAGVCAWKAPTSTGRGSSVDGGDEQRAARQPDALGLALRLAACQRSDHVVAAATRPVATRKPPPKPLLARPLGAAPRVSSVGARACCPAPFRSAASGPSRRASTT